MDLLLMGLLLIALWFGVRLNGRLKALKAGQEGFARAVAELDTAAIKAFTSLRDLRADADESQELLHGRILAARELLQRLETQIARAERAQAALPVARPEAPVGDLPVRDLNDRFHNAPEAAEGGRSDVSEVGLAAIGEMLRAFAKPETPVAEAPPPAAYRPAVNPSRRQPYPGEDDLFDSDLPRARPPVAPVAEAPQKDAERMVPVSPQAVASPSAASMFRRYR